MGANNEGQLGLGDTEARDTPTLISGLGNISWISAGSSHSAAVTRHGEVFVWGNNSDGQIGLGIDINFMSAPTPLIMDSNIKQVSCGYYHTLFLSDEGNVFSCGEGDDGKLGLGSDENAYTPMLVIMARSVSLVAAGGKHSLAITEEGEAAVWGNNERGQLGIELDETTVNRPTMATQLGKLAYLSAGELHSAFITSDEELLVCGDSSHGKLGLTSNQNRSVQLPMQIPKISSMAINLVKCGGCHTMVLASPRTSPVYKIYIDNCENNGNGSQTLLSAETPDRNLLSIPHPELQSPPSKTLLPSKSLLATGTLYPESLLLSDNRNGSNPQPSSDDEGELPICDTCKVQDYLDLSIRRAVSREHINGINGSEKKGGRLSRFFSRLKKTTQNGKEVSNVEMDNKLRIGKQGNSQNNSQVVPLNGIELDPKKSKMCTIL